MDELQQLENTKEIWEISREILLCKRDLLSNFLRLGRLLIEAKKENKFLGFASHIKNFNDFLKEMDIKKSSAYNAMAVVQKFGDDVIRMQLNIDPTRLVRLLPLRLDQEKTEEFLHKAAELPAPAFDDSLKAYRGTTTTDECAHAGEVELYSRCCTCGKFIREQ